MHAIAQPLQEGLAAHHAFHRGVVPQERCDDPARRRRVGRPVRPLSSTAKKRISLGAGGVVDPQAVACVQEVGGDRRAESAPAL